MKEDFMFFLPRGILWLGYEYFCLCKRTRQFLMKPAMSMFKVNSEKDVFFLSVDT